MEPAPQELTRIKVQTARMMEIYALLRRELAQQPPNAFRTEDIQQLHRAIATVEANMRQLQEYIVRTRERSSPQSAQARELEDILNAVLAWAQEQPN